MFSVHPGINIIIPLAGIGQRFKEDGYAAPKPLIKVLGEPIIFHVIKSLKTRPNDKIYIVYTPCLDVYGFSGIISKYFPSVKLIKISYPTRGAVETVLCGLQQITDNNPILVCDGDTFYKDDIIQDCYDIPGNGIFYFKDSANNPIFSYIKTTFDCKVIAIKEKEKISDSACTGAYLFKSTKLLKLYCEQILQTEQTSKGEYYISGIYSQMIKTGERVNAFLVENFTCLGTPNQVKAYCMANNDVKTNNHKRICFDLDGTLCTFPPTKNGYFGVQPIEKNIKKLKHLHSLGHTIIIHTARGMGSTGQNTGAALSKAHESVFWFLKEYKVPYDEIYFGKPQADFYIDDLAVPAHTDLDKELGFYDGKIEPRYFNKVRMNDTWTFKETNNPGEVYWYQNIPETVKMHFPIVNEAHTMFINGCGSIMIETIKGVPLSYLLVNGSLTTADIDLLFETLSKIHNSEYTPSNIGIYGNYAKKVTDRIKQINSINFPSWEHEAQFIITKLEGYQNNDLGIKGVVHGDPVLTNIFLCNGRALKFIDMRGMVDTERTIFGDVIYDYAKVYQSLCGYDCILNGVDHEGPYHYKLKDYFELEFIKRFPQHFFWLKLITASHFLSLIPLHTDYDKQIKYLGLMKKLIE